MTPEELKQEVVLATERYYASLDELAGKAGQNREEWVATVEAALEGYPDYDETTLDWDE